MSVRHENIGIVVSMAVIVIGCWIANWDPGEDAAMAIVGAAFVIGYGVIAFLFERDGRRVPPRHGRSRGSSP